MTMQANANSKSWYRVAELKPRLRSQAVVEPRHYREQLWYVLHDQSTARHFQFTPTAWYLISQMDGTRTLQSIWDAALNKLGEASVPSQDEIIQLLGRLHSTDVLHCDVSPDTQELFRRYQQAQSVTRKRRYMTPLSQRWSLVDPDKFLQRALPLVKPLFSWQAGLLWLLVVASALILAASHWTALSSHIFDTTLAPRNWVLLWLCFPLLKALHELGHAFAVKVWGGEVHSMGVALLVLAPVPFVDASAASAFPAKSKRILVSAAGMMVEVFIASLALFLWLAVEPGIIRDIAAVVMFIAGLSTLLFNANPLLKFDGYYMLVDAIEIPNLATRANRYYGYLIERYGFGLGEARSPVTAPGETAWFACYGIAAFCYRLLIAFSIILFVAGKFFFVGVILALWASVSMLLMPLFKTVSFVLASPRIARQRTRAISTSLAVVIAVSSVVGFLPMPFWTRVDGVVWMPEQAQVRAGVAGNITKLLATPGEQVEVGDQLFASEDPFLSHRVEILTAQAKELNNRYHALRSVDRVQAEIIDQQRQSKRAELSQAQQQLDKQLTVAAVAGTFIVPTDQDLPGSYVEQGQLLGYVARQQDTSVRVVVSQADISLVRHRTQDVQIKFSSRLADSVTARVEREIPAANFNLPSKVLGSAGGGQILVDPDDERGRRAQQKVFQLDLAFVDQIPRVYFGERVQVRFNHGKVPLAQQWYRSIRQLFLRSFGV
jgi:putative peptide zinc metalloprotease protein